MTIGEIFTAKVERLVSGGAGILHQQGQTVFMDHTAPGDTVVGKIREIHTRWARADLVEITERSRDRVEPLCPAYKRCGGCSLQHLSYEAQVREKSAVLQDSLRRIGGIAGAPEPAVYSAQPFEYRNRFQFHRIRPVGYGAQPAVGFKSRGGKAVTPVEDCPIAYPAIRQALRDRKLAPPPDRDRFTVYARGHAFLQQGGVQRGAVPLLDRTLVIDAGVFFQSNAAMLEKVILRLRDLAETADRSRGFADVYCGVGTFAAFLGGYFSGVDLVEQDKTALTLAHENTRGLNRKSALSVDTWLTHTPRLHDRFGLMVLDPPRQGLSPFGRRRLSQAGPGLLAYLSCDAASLARDAGELIRGGYTLSALDLYDFYPQTAHIESLALFKR
ncbi:MAG: class I SAM-dependent RNA methyltransferase [Spirochaetaceae bacterium]|nr:class I SAM-dependent RNA methyltransferase [Spirochaetaceae bacterium]